jgi:diaminopropionate ammonia-lyase
MTTVAATRPVPARWTSNPRRSPGQRPPGSDAGAEPIEFHRTLPDYSATPLVDLPDLAERLGIGTLLVKDESSRLGLPAFKMLGASWAAYRCLAERAGSGVEPSLEALRAAAVGLPPTTLVTATDGNHGRAVARMARYLGLPAIVLVPSVVPDAAAQLIRGEGADVRVVGAPYDDAVQEAAGLCDGHPDRILVQDTSWPGYEITPRWIVDGYSTLFTEAALQMAEAGITADAEVTVVVPAGVGSLAHAAVLHCRREPGWRAVTVEPDVAPCIAASLAAGELCSVETGETSMAGLNCGTPSALAWPDLHSDLVGGVVVTDDEATVAAESLRAHGVDSGPCGAASLAAARIMAGDPGARTDLGLHSGSTVLLLNTEGAPRD